MNGTILSYSFPSEKKSELTIEDLNLIIIYET